jgi:hypothetical protein
VNICVRSCAHWANFGVVQLLPLLVQVHACNPVGHVGCIIAFLIGIFFSGYYGIMSASSVE